MIFVVREKETCPKVLKNNGVNWTNNLIKAINQYKTDPTKENKNAKENAESKYNHPEVKNALKDMFSGKCAYCESYVLHIDYGDIEHFAPKSIYPHLCYDWDNLLLSCGICNGSSFKGNKYPTEAQNGPFVNPTIEDPNDFFEYLYDHEVGIALIKPKNHRGETTENDLGLNRKELVKNRSEKLKKVVLIALIASKGDMKAKEILLESCFKESEYSAFSISIAKHFNLL